MAKADVYLRVVITESFRHCTEDMEVMIEVPTERDINEALRSRLTELVDKVIEKRTEKLLLDQRRQARQQGE